MDPATPTFKSKSTLILDLPPSCLEFVPRSQSYFVVGTYFLEPSAAENVSSMIEINQTRSGSLNLYSLQNDEMYPFLNVESQSTVDVAS